MSKSSAIPLKLLQSPFLWGILGSVAFYSLLHTGLPGTAFFTRYCASHEVEYIETIAFFVGLAALGVRYLEVAAESQWAGRTLLGAIPRGGQPVSEAAPLLARLGGLPAWQQESFLVRRLRDALDYVARNGTAGNVEERLKYLADEEAGRQTGRYGLVRLVIWAIPILGFLGTVIGIALALANLSPNELEKTLPAVMGGLTIAFDTTALALALSMILMFIQFLVERKETALLAAVDRQADAELLGRFEQVADGPEGELTAVRRMVEAVLRSSEDLVARQAEIWRSTIDAAHAQWAQLSGESSRQIEDGFSRALAEGLRVYAEGLSAAEEAAAEKTERHWERVEQASRQNVEVVAGLRKSVVEQSEVLSRTVEAMGQVMRLEEVLNRNLASLAGAKNFEQTVMSLAAAIHLLNARLADPPRDVPVVHLEPGRRSGHAA